MGRSGPRISISVRQLQYTSGNINGGLRSAICRQHDAVNVWSSPHTAMALRACTEGNRHKAQGPARDSECQLVTISFNIGQPGVLVEDGNVGFFKRKTDFRQEASPGRRPRPSCCSLLSTLWLQAYVLFRSRPKGDPGLRTSNLCRRGTSAWGQLAANVYKYTVTIGARPCTGLGAARKARCSSRRPTQSTTTYCQPPRGQVTNGLISGATGTRARRPASTCARAQLARACGLGHTRAP